MAYKFALIVYIMESKNDLLTHSDARYVRTLWNSITKHIMQRISARDYKECNLVYQQKNTLQHYDYLKMYVYIVNRGCF